MDPLFHPESPIGEKVRRFQEWSITNYRWPWPLFTGRGIFQYSFGLMPHRKPIAVVGKHCYQDIV